MNQSRKQLKLLHPISYSAGCLFKNGEIISTNTHQGLEYGCTVDAISRLAYTLE